MPRKLKVVALREDYATLTGDYKQAIILNELVYRQSRAADIDEYLNELRADASAFLTHGWFKRSAAEVARDTLLKLSPSNTLTHLRRLVGAGWVTSKPRATDWRGGCFLNQKRRFLNRKRECTNQKRGVLNRKSIIQTVNG
jgi:hypothetical protein